MMMRHICRRSNNTGILATASTKIKYALVLVENDPLFDHKYQASCAVDEKFCFVFLIVKQSFTTTPKYFGDSTPNVAKYTY